MTDTPQDDGLAGELAALDCEEACLKGTPMIPIHRDTLKRILAALTTREAVVEECAKVALDCREVNRAIVNETANRIAAAIRALAAKEVE